MAIWSVEIKELEILNESLKDHFPEVEKELSLLFSSDDPNVLLLYSRRCLETIIADICSCELKKDRGTEPLKGIIDKFNKERIVPAHIIASMHGLNELSTFGTHPKEFDPEQVKPVLINLLIVLKWYSQYKKPETFNKLLFDEVKNKAGRVRDDTKTAVSLRKRDLVIISAIIMAVMITIAIVILLKAGNSKIPKSIAVLPFTSLSSDTDQEYFSIGIVDEILDKLFKIGGLKVIARTSTERFRNSDLSLKEIARKLGVATIMEGSVRRAGDNVRITVQLIDARTEAHLWSEIYDRTVSDIFMIQSDVAQNVARELKAAITPENRQLIDKTPTTNMAAWEAYQMGIFYHRRLNKDDLDAALKYFELALERDSLFSLAYTGIGRVWLARQQMGLAKASEATPKAEAAVLKALRLDSNSSEAYHVLGGVKTWGQWDWKAGEAAYRKAIELNPQNADAHSTLSHVLNVLGRPEEAMKHIEIAFDLDPLNSKILAFYGVDLMFNRQYGKAASAFREALELSPSQGVAINIFSALYLDGKEQEAAEMLKRFHNDQESVSAMEEGYKLAGFRGAVKKLADLNSANSLKSYYNPYGIAVLYSLAADIDNAILWLEKSFEEHNPNMPYLLSPVFDTLRDDPRFKDLHRKMNLPEANKI